MFVRSEKSLLALFLAAAVLLYLLIALFSTGTYDPGDGIQHYLISRYSWKHPELFLHHWGKPFFTLASSPFTQFGLTGAGIFNILCAACSALLCFKIAKRLNMDHALLAIPFLCFAPVYFSSIQSGLTEPFFGFVLVSGIYGFIPSEAEEKTGRKIIFSSLLVSFLPFIRTEGFLILPLFLAVLAYRKKFRVIPLLAFGTVAYSVIGYFYYHDLLWVMHQNPYKGAAALYGKGTWYHFFIRGELIWGLPLLLLFIAGWVWAGFKFMKGRNFNATEKPIVPLLNHSQAKPTSEELILIFGSFFIYFTSHVIFWWQGLFGSLGLIRVIAGIMPLAALISLRGLNFFLPFAVKKAKHERIFFCLLLCIMAFLASFHHRNYFSLNKEEAVIKQAADWIKNSEYKNEKIYFMHPYVSVALDLDRYDRSTNGELWGLDKNDYAKDIPAGTLVLWDAHFGPNEGEIKLEGLLNNPSYLLLNKFVPEKEFKTLGERTFEVYLFVKK